MKRMKKYCCLIADVKRLEYVYMYINILYTSGSLEWGRPGYHKMCGNQPLYKHVIAVWYEITSSVLRVKLHERIRGLLNL